MLYFRLSLLTVQQRLHSKSAASITAIQYNTSQNLPFESLRHAHALIPDHHEKPEMEAAIRRPQSRATKSMAVHKSRLDLLESIARKWRNQILFKGCVMINNLITHFLKTTTVNYPDHRCCVIALGTVDG